MIDLQKEMELASNFRKTEFSMTVMSPALYRKIQEIISSEFTIEPSARTDMLTFRSASVTNHVFYLFYEVLTEHVILEVAKILVESYRGIRDDTPKDDKYSDDETTVLNCPQEFSGEFVGAVADLKASALHKLLLLASSMYVLSKKRSATVIKLAQKKNEIQLDPNKIVTDRQIYDRLKKSYIFPGVAPETFISYTRSFDMWPIRCPIEIFSQLMAFSVNNIEDLTLGEHLALPFLEGISTRKSITGFSQPTDIRNILISQHKDLAYLMTASEVISLSLILDGSMFDGDFPTSILSNRSKAMEPNVLPLELNGADSVLRYLSKNEQKSLRSETFVEQLNDLLKSGNRKSKTPPIVYAALAEVLVVKGERIAFQVACELSHLPFIHHGGLKIYEATVAIIALALNPGVEDFPFSWVAQLSEHAWVFNSHLLEDHLAAAL